jgi:predicted HAD superfamily Cof-like phosphohydrolase
MREAVHDVMQFHQATDTPILQSPAVPDQQAIERRVALIEEEFLETMRGLGYTYNVSRSGKTPDRLKKVQYKDPDLVELADGIIDSIYVLIGTGLEFGIPMSRVWDEIQRSNMSKKDPVTGKILKRADGKILKGPNFSPADVEKVLASSGSSQ